jgi:hypothetical protein
MPFLPKPYFPTLKFNFPQPLAGYDRLMSDPKKYRDRAERLRKEAIGTPNRDVRGTMIEVADLYDRLADILERQRRHPTIP